MSEQNFSPEEVIDSEVERQPKKAVLDLNPGAEAIVKIGDQVAIDGRRGGHYNRIDKKAWDDMSRVYGSVRHAYETGGDMNEALSQIMGELGFDVDEAEIIGEPPSHWIKRA